MEEDENLDRPLLKWKDDKTREKKKEIERESEGEWEGGGMERFGDLSRGLRRIKSRTGACPRNT